MKGSIKDKGSRWVRERQAAKGGVERTVQRSIRVQDEKEKCERAQRLLKAA
jgi:hypothetical protein